MSPARNSSWRKMRTSRSRLVVTPCSWARSRAAAKRLGRFATGRGMGDDLGQHGVVERAHLGAVLHAAVDAYLHRPVAAVAGTSKRCSGPADGCQARVASSA